MKYYLDITLLPNIEIPLHFIWEKAYQQVHLALVENGFESDEVIKRKNGMEEQLKKSHIAISFPDYKSNDFPLGNRLRLFAQSEEQLQELLDIGKWFNGLADYIEWPLRVKKVPQSATFVRFIRVQLHTNVERLARRRAKRNEESFEQAMKHFDGFKDQESNFPFVYMTSLSTSEATVPSSRNKFRLFIEKEDVEKAQSGMFNCYGLSSRDPDKQATVPWF